MGKTYTIDESSLKEVIEKKKQEEEGKEEEKIEIEEELEEHKEEKKEKEAEKPQPKKLVFNNDKKKEKEQPKHSCGTVLEDIQVRDYRGNTGTVKFCPKCRRVVIG